MAKITSAETHFVMSAMMKAMNDSSNDSNEVISRKKVISKIACSSKQIQNLKRQTLKFISIKNFFLLFFFSLKSFIVLKIFIFQTLKDLNKSHDDHN